MRKDSLMIKKQYCFNYSQVYFHDHFSNGFTAAIINPKTLQMIDWLPIRKVKPLLSKDIKGK